MARCSVCHIEGHNSNNRMFHPDYKALPKEHGDIPKSRGKTSFKNGKRYQTNICDRLNHITIDGTLGVATEVKGADSGPDISYKIKDIIVGVEVKNKGGFEGGSSKMEYSEELKTLHFPHSKLHQRYLGGKTIYGGRNLPWYKGERTQQSYNSVSHVFDVEIRIELPETAMSEYYNNSGVHYIQIEGYGLYHTGNDILKLGVPFFKCEQRMRIRTSKHKKPLASGASIPSDVVGDINYIKKTLIRSEYDLNDNLPSSMKRVVGE